MIIMFSQSQSLSPSIARQPDSGRCILCWIRRETRDLFSSRITLTQPALAANSASRNKKASGAQCFIMALGLFWDIVSLS